MEARSKTKFRKLVKEELNKATGKTIDSITYREDNMTIHFTDNTHLKIEAGIYGVMMEAELTSKENK